jgi:hypothetical protein
VSFDLTTATLALAVLYFAAMAVRDVLFDRMDAKRGPR